MCLSTYLAVFRDSLILLICRIFIFRAPPTPKLNVNEATLPDNDIPSSSTLDLDLERARPSSIRLPATLLDAAQRAFDYKRVIERLGEICRKEYQSSKTAEAVRTQMKVYRFLEEQAQADLVSFLTVSDLINVRESERKAQLVVEDLIVTVEELLKAEKGGEGVEVESERLDDVFVVESELDVEDEKPRLEIPKIRISS